MESLNQDLMDLESFLKERNIKQEDTILLLTNTLFNELSNIESLDKSLKHLPKDVSIDFRDYSIVDSVSNSYPNSSSSTMAKALHMLIYTFNRIKIDKKNNNQFDNGKYNV